MNHLTKFHLRKLLQNSYSGPSYKRFYSSERSSAGLRLSLIVGTTTLATSTAAYLYAKYDETFRKQLLSAAPPLSFVFEDKKTAPEPVPQSFMKPKTIPKVVESKEQSKPEAVKVAASTPPVVQKVQEAEKAQPKPTSSEIKADIAKAFDKAMDDDTVKMSPDNELELRVQLKRQLYILQEFFKEQLILYKTELKRKLEVDLKNKVLEEKEKIASDYEESFKKLKQMESLLEVRDKLDKQEKATKKLWLMSQTLAHLLDHDRSQTQAKPIRINEQVDCVRDCISKNFPGEKLFNVALESLPASALAEGVYSEADLVQRFNKVEKMCNSVALISNDYAPFYEYLKSYAYSLLRPFYQVELNLTLDPIRIKRVTQEELNGTLHVNPGDWDTYDILERVHYCVQHRNLKLALRYANQLRGEPRRVARDWMNDTRTHLEVRQALDLLQTKMAAINLHQFSLTN